jgi:hypothetical protein
LMDEDRKAGFCSPKGTFYWTFCAGGNCTLDNFS